MSIVTPLRAESSAEPRAGNPPAIRVRGLGLHYGDTSAFSGIDLDVPTGSITAVIGPSGCGKTSFLNCLNRLTDLIPATRVTGSVHIDGMDALAQRQDLLELRRRVGMIFQKPNPFPMSIRRNIELPLAEHGLRDRDARAAAMQATLESAGLWDEVKHRLDTSALALSGGQRQRLCIARAIALKPRVLLMDEPCSALDPIASSAVESLILALRGSYTVLIVTHNLAQARRIADRVAVFWNQDGRGCLLESGPTEQVFDRPSQAITAAYLEGRCC